MAEKKYKVIGQCPIAGVVPGEIVTLDPDDQTPGATNVQALIDGGHVEETSGPKTLTTSKDDKGK